MRKESGHTRVAIAERKLSIECWLEEPHVCHSRRRVEKFVLWCKLEPCAYEHHFSVWRHWLDEPLMLREAGLCHCTLMVRGAGLHHWTPMVIGACLHRCTLIAGGGLKSFVRLDYTTSLTHASLSWDAGLYYASLSCNNVLVGASLISSTGPSIATGTDSSSSFYANIMLSWGAGVENFASESKDLGQRDELTPSDIALGSLTLSAWDTTLGGLAPCAAFASLIKLEFVDASMIKAAFCRRSSAGCD